MPLAASSDRRLRRRLVAGFCVLAAFQAAFTAYEIHESFEKTVENAQREAASRAEIAAESVARSLAEVDRLLADARQDLALSGVDPAAVPPAPVLFDNLRRMGERAHQIESLFILSEDASVLWLSGPNAGTQASAQASARMRELIARAQRDGVEQPLLGPAQRSGALLVARWLGERPGGAVVGARVDLRVFSAAYARLQPSAHSAFAVLMADGEPVGHFGAAMPRTDRSAWLKYVAESGPHGAEPAQVKFASIDAYTVAQRPVGEWPLVVSVAYHSGDYLADLRGEIVEWIGMAAIMLAALAGVLWLLLRESRRSEAGRAELALTQYSIDHAADMVLWIDADGQVRYRSGTARARLGRDAAQPRPALAALLPEVDAPSWQRLWRELQARGELQFETAAATRDGVRLPLEVVLTRIALPDESIACAVCRDISERRRAAEAVALSERRLRAVFENTAHVAVIGLDHTRRVTFWNGAAATLFGWSADEAIGRPIDSLLFGPETREADVARLSAWLAGGLAPAAGEQTLMRRDGSAAHVFSSYVLVRGAEGQVEVFCTHLDLSERMAAERALRQLNESLESRVQERTVELEAAIKELESFSYSVSHDLRSPLRAVSGFATLLEQDHAERIGETGRDYLRRMRSAALRMSDLIDGLLGLSRITRQPIRRSLVDVSALAQEVVADLRGSEPSRRVEAHIAAGLSASADATLLRSLLLNLIGNAWKYSAREACARIEFGAIGNEAETVFFVRDNGVGFDMAYADKLFGAFQRLHGVGEFDGVGIGLATARRIVVRHGGRIWAEAAPGEGATFYFTLAHGDERRYADAA